MAKQSMFFIMKYTNLHNSNSPLIFYVFFLNIPSNWIFESFSLTSVEASILYFKQAMGFFGVEVCVGCKSSGLSPSDIFMKTGA